MRMPRTMAALLKSEPNFEENMHSVLGLKPEIVSYWIAKSGGLVLESTNLCESSNGDFIVKFTYKLANQSVGKVRQNVNNKENPTKSHPISPDMPAKVKSAKKKSPSRRRRDRERFRKWLERKKEKRTQEVLNSATVSTPSPSRSPKTRPSPVMSPPEIPGPSQPPVGTDSDAANTLSDQVTPDQSEPEAPSKEPCKCKDCERFTIDQEPYADLKQQCEWALCDITAADMVLRNCTRCYMAAYCSREHQKEDWYIHKDVCNAEDGAHCRQETEDWRRWKAEAHHHQ